MGVDIIQNCEVTSINVQNGNVTGIQTTKGKINSNRIGVAAAGHSSVIANMVGIKTTYRKVDLCKLWFQSPSSRFSIRL